MPQMQPQQPGTTTETPEISLNPDDETAGPKDREENSENTDENSKKEEKGIKAFFKKPTNRVLVIGLGITILAVIIVSIVSGNSQNSAKTEISSPSENKTGATESLTAEKEDTSVKTDETTAPAGGENASIDCSAKKDFYTMSTNYSIADGVLESFTITLDLDKVDPETLSDQDKELYSSISALGNNLNAYKDSGVQGITVTSSDTDSSLYLWLKANRSRITDEAAISQFFKPYDGYSAQEVATLATRFGNQDYGLTCEVR